MPREIITIQVGQCGNQLGYGFWDLLLREHAERCKAPVFNDPLSSFFKNVDSNTGRLLRPGDKGYKDIQDLKARAVVVDMETGVINHMLKTKLGEIFDTQQFVYDVSGAGNNWAHGFGEYGPKYREMLANSIRKTAEECNSLQSFFLLHSLGGGTGSGLGSYILTLLSDYFPEVFKFTASVFPSADDDVNISPYNSLLACSKLVEHADCVLPIDNDALLRIVTKKASDDKEKSKKEAYADMNGLIAHLLSNLTCSMRFPGSLNIDMNEITMNLVPFPRMHFLLSSMSPLQTFIHPKTAPRSLDQMFLDTLSRDNFLIDCTSQNQRYIALAYMIRGDVSFSDVSRNIEKISQKVRLIDWNSEGFKYGICSVPSIGNQRSILSLANNTAFSDVLDKMANRFKKLYSKKVFVHHYTQYMEESIFTEGFHTIDSLRKEYIGLQNWTDDKETQRYKPLF